MLAYIIPLLLCLALSIRKHKPTTKEIVFLFITVAFFYCSGYMTGSDWRGYEKFYGGVGTTETLASWGLEPGYYLLMLGFKKLGFSFFPFTIFLKTLVLYAVFYFAFKNSRHFYLIIFTFLTLQGVFLFVGAPFRNLLTIGLFLYAYTKYYQGDRKKMYYLCIMLALSIHFSAFVLFFVPLLAKLRYKIIHIMFVFTIIISAIPNISLDILNNFIRAISFLSHEYGSYLSPEANETGRTFLSIGSVFNIVVFYFLYYYRKQVPDYFKGLFKLGLISFLFYRLYLVVPIFSRFYLYFVPFYIIGFVYIVQSMQKSRNFFKIGLITYCLLIFTNVVVNNYAYIPYSNYWVYYFKDDLKPYNYRSSYNFNAYFERTGKSFNP